jgi:hypothetical protein
MTWIRISIRKSQLPEEQQRCWNAYLIVNEAWTENNAPSTSKYRSGSGKI